MVRQSFAAPSLQELDSSQLGSSTDMVGALSISIVPKSAEAQVAPAVTTPAFAMCTLGGSLALYTIKEKLWEMQVPHQLFAISKLDITADGSDEVIACAWDGTTLIVDSRQNMVRYNFEEDVCAFTSGTYAREPGVNRPCLVYVTLSGRVVIYYDVILNTIATSTLSQITTPIFEAHRTALSEHYGIPGPASTLSMADRRSIQHSLLYENTVQEWTRRKKLLESQLSALRLQNQADEEAEEGLEGGDAS